MPVMNGLHTSKMLRWLVPNMRIIIMTMENSIVAKAEAHVHGTHGFLWKPQITNDLMTEIHRVFNGNPGYDGLARS